MSDSYTAPGKGDKDVRPGSEFMPKHLNSTTGFGLASQAPFLFLFSITPSTKLMVYIAP